MVRTKTTSKKPKVTPSKDREARGTAAAEETDEKVHEDERDEPQSEDHDDDPNGDNDDPNGDLNDDENDVAAIDNDTHHDTNNDTHHETNETTNTTETTESTFPLRLHSILTQIENDGHSSHSSSHSSHSSIHSSSHSSHSSILSWTPQGDAITVHDELLFEEIIIPKYFQSWCTMTKVASFYSQLYMHGFRRSGGAGSAGGAGVIGRKNGKNASPTFRNPLFVRGRLTLAYEIERKVEKPRPNRVRKKIVLQQKFQEGDDGDNGDDGGDGAEDATDASDATRKKERKEQREQIISGEVAFRKLKSEYTQAETEYFAVQDEITRLESQLAAAKQRLEHALPTYTQLKQTIFQKDLELHPTEPWNVMYHKLLQWKEHRISQGLGRNYGHDISCLVPESKHSSPDTKKLAQWVMNQRSCYKNWNKGTKEGRRYMKGYRVDALEKIGFVWNTIDLCWDMNLEALKEYHQATGSWSVPHKVNPTLCKFIGTVSTAMRKIEEGILQHELTEERLEKLRGIGFVPRRSNRQRSIKVYDFEEHFDLLVRFKELHGDCEVNSRFKKFYRGGRREEDKILGENNEFHILLKFIPFVRREYENYLEGNSSYLDEVKVKRLEDLGVCLRPLHRKGLKRRRRKRKRTDEEENEENEENDGSNEKDENDENNDNSTPSNDDDRNDKGDNEDMKDNEDSEDNEDAEDVEIEPDEKSRNNDLVPKLPPMDAPSFDGESGGEESDGDG